MGAIDIWCNIFTEEGLTATFRKAREVAEVVEWWGMQDRIVSRTPTEFAEYMDAAGMDAVLIPAAKMASYRTQELIWNVSEEDVHELTQELPGRVYGLVGINPRDGMDGVRRLEKWVTEYGFVGAHLHSYGFGLPVNHRRFYPFYTKCVELGVPVVMQVGHSAEAMPSEMGRPIHVDDIALDFPELKIVATHTGWPWVEELLAVAWKHRNVYIGTSAHHPKYWDPALVSFANSRGRGKVLFGTDWPVMDYADALAAVEQLPLKDVSRELLLGKVAREVFSLERVLSPTA